MSATTSAHLTVALLRATAWWQERSKDDRGEVTSTVIIIGILAALALAVGAIIYAKVTNSAENIPTS